MAAHFDSRGAFFGTLDAVVSCFGARAQERSGCQMSDRGKSLLA